MNHASFPSQVIRASAGTGKTHQLTNRYLALLAAGVEPNTMLAATFTRKAAAEILNRVLERLADAAAAGDSAAILARQIGATSIGTNEFAQLLRDLLRDLHRVRVGTLDSFYNSLAHNFSFELGLPAGWTICEPADDERHYRDAVEQLLDRHPDQIGNLIPLLNKGLSNRSVSGELMEVIKEHYDIFRASNRAAWHSLRVTKPVDPLVRRAAIESLKALDCSGSGYKRFAAARDSDIAAFERQDWVSFVSKGLAAKVMTASPFYGKEIPPNWQAPYNTLLQHAKSEILRKLADQTTATWELLDRFHGELWPLKLQSGALRFGEVTQAVVDGFRTHALSPESLSFRLDGELEHLLLDEFQDTSLPQWKVLEPLAQRITKQPNGALRSFFCVGDEKQAIYGWRGGMVEIFDKLQTSLGKLEENSMLQSRRSAQPIINVVNKVFDSLLSSQQEETNDALAAWGSRFESHTTFKKDAPGYVCLQAGPAELDGEGISQQRAKHCRFVAEKIRDLVNATSGMTLGVLCRKNDTLARMIYELRSLGVSASEEGGSPLPDSPAVEVMLSLFKLADHPGHSAAAFHLLNSPLKEQIALLGECSADALSRRLRCQLHSEGYPAFTQDWAQKLAPACGQRDLARLQQLVEMAFVYQPRSTLRAADFVAFVCQTKVPDPSGVGVRVLTMHGAKGMEFDVVFLPELDTAFDGWTPNFVVGRDPRTLEVSFVCRYAKSNVRNLMTPQEQEYFEIAKRHRVEESLSLLYVAMTRAKHAMHLFVPGPRKGNRDGWHKLLVNALAPHAELLECNVLYESGDELWHHKPAKPPIARNVTQSRQPRPISFSSAKTQRRRGLERIAPSRREGKGQVRLHTMFHPSEGTGMAAGTLYHAWFEAIGWLEDGEPSDADLHSIANKHRSNLPTKTWCDLDRLILTFRKWLEMPVIRGVLQRTAYSNPGQPNFPRALRAIWTKSLRPQTVQRERRFLVPEGEAIWDGSFDRIVWLGVEGRIMAADVLDFKTDDIKPGDQAALAERTEHYRPQLELYRQAAGRLANLPPDCIAARLVFPNPGQVAEL